MRTTLYDLLDRPIATLENDENLTIRLYNGHTVACLIDEIIAGWNGNELGQVRNNIIFNTSGKAIGTLGSKKHITPPYQPIGDYSQSTKSLYKLGGGKKVLPVNPISDEKSLEEVLRSGGTYKIPKLKFPGEPLSNHSDQL